MCNRHETNNSSPIHTFFACLDEWELRDKESGKVSLELFPSLMAFKRGPGHVKCRATKFKVVEVNFTEDELELERLLDKEE